MQLPSPMWLPGGWSGDVVRIGATVRRPIRPSTPAVHALLRYLAEVGFEGSPRVLGIDDEEREVLSFVVGETIGGHEPWPGWTRHDEALVSAGRLLRQYHDAVAGFRGPVDAVWRYREGPPGPGEIVCHNDSTPQNLVYRDNAVHAFIDWDLAGPHDYRSDLALLAWQMVPLYPPAICARIGWREAPDWLRRLRMLVDAYGLIEREGFLEVVQTRIRESRNGILAGADRGESTCLRLFRAGVTEEMAGTASWVVAHADRLQRALE